MERLYEYYYKLLDEVNTDFIRYIYEDINWDSRMIGITGPRGVGKTTLVLQYIKKNLDKRETLYVTAEDFYFAENKLVDLADSFSKNGGKYLFIDEIHKYQNWSKDLKLIYDYYSDLHVVFTGSSVLDIKKGASDLSRRATMFNIQGLSFREYLQLFHDIKSKKYSLDEILDHKVEIQGLKYPLPLFKDYLMNGYYPFALDGDFKIRLMQVVNQTVESDIPQFAGMNVSTGRKLKKLLSIISKSVPFKPNFSNLAKRLDASRNIIPDYCIYLEEAGMISQLKDSTSGISGLGKLDKIYLDNTNLIYNLGGDDSNIGNIRETFFFNQTRIISEVLASPYADFLIDGKTFEVGCKHKGQKQIKNIDNAFVVKDNIEFGFSNIIPLWQFGLFY